MGDEDGGGGSMFAVILLLVILTAIVVIALYYTCRLHNPPKFLVNIFTSITPAWGPSCSKDKDAHTKKAS